jgi:methionyl aminopeptidase
MSLKKFDIAKMQLACKSAAETLKLAGQAVRPGITTGDINTIVHNDTIKRGGYPATLNYRGFPKSCCTSVNDVACHGIPGSYVLKDGDIINVDVTTILDGHFGDTSATFFVGEPIDSIRNLVEITHLAMNIGISHVKPGDSLNNVGIAIQKVADDYGYGIVKEFGGHGIGTQFHTTPHVYHFDHDGNDVILKPGMTFTIEPMFNAGSPEVTLDSDGWTVRTSDGSTSAQFEHTILVTETGVEILTLTD